MHFFVQVKVAGLLHRTGLCAVGLNPTMSNEVYLPDAAKTSRRTTSIFTGSLFLLMWAFRIASVEMLTAPCEQLFAFHEKNTPIPQVVFQEMICLMGNTKRNMEKTRKKKKPQLFLSRNMFVTHLEVWLVEFSDRKQDFCLYAASKHSVLRLVLSCKLQGGLPPGCLFIAPAPGLLALPHEPTDTVWAFPRATMSHHPPVSSPLLAFDLQTNWAQKCCIAATRLVLVSWRCFCSRPLDKSRNIFWCHWYWLCF